MRVYRSREGLPVDEPVCLFIRKNVDSQIKFEVLNAREDNSFFISLLNLHDALAD